MSEPMSQQDRQRLHRMAGEIGERRRDLGWSQSELAKRAGLVRNVINVTENELAMPSPENLERMRKALALGSEQGDFL